MTTTVDTLRSANYEVARTWMTTLNEPAWWNLIHDDIVLEFPYAPSLGMPVRHEGKEAAIAYIKALFARVGNLKFHELVITPTIEPDVFFGEYAANITKSDGHQYAQSYINKLRVKDGKMIYMKELWNPQAILDAARGKDSTKSS